MDNLQMLQESSFGLHWIYGVYTNTVGNRKLLVGHTDTLGTLLNCKYGTGFLM